MTRTNSWNKYSRAEIAVTFLSLQLSFRAMGQSSCSSHLFFTERRGCTLWSKQPVSQGYLFFLTKTGSHGTQLHLRIHTATFRSSSDASGWLADFMVSLSIIACQTWCGTHGVCTRVEFGWCWSDDLCVFAAWMRPTECDRQSCWVFVVVLN